MRRRASPDGCGEIRAVLLGSYDPELGAEYPVYIVGIDAAGNLVGLKSAAVWT